MLFTLLPAGQISAVQIREAPYQEMVVLDGGTLTGQVSFSGEMPAASELLITKDFEVCGMGFRERRDVDVAEGGRLRSVVVYIADIDKGKPWPEAPEGYGLDQRDCIFEPYVQVVPRGAELQITNSDPVLHNVHGYEVSGGSRRTLFNLGQPNKGVITRTLRPKRSQVVGLECDAHDFMLGWIFAADSPYAAAVDSVGHFSMADIPPGTYRVEAWHPFLGFKGQEVTVTAGTVSEVNFEFGAD